MKRLFSFLGAKRKCDDDLSFTVLFSISTLFSILTLATPSTVAADSKRAAIEGALKFGLVYTDLTITAFKSYDKPDAGAGNATIENQLKSVATGYKTKFEMARAGTALLDSTLDWVIQPVAASGGPPGLVVGGIVTWGKNKAMDALKVSIDNDAKKYLAANLDKFSSAAGADYESLRGTKDLEKIKEAIDKNGLLMGFKDQFEKDPIAKEAIQTAFAKNILATEKATLDKLSETNADVAANAEQISEVATALSSYTRRVDKSLHSLNAQVGGLQDAMADAQNALSALSAQTNNNSRDLKLVGEVLFKNASATDKLALLDGGWNSELGESQRGQLITYLQAEQKKEKFLADMGSAVQTISQIGQIASNLGIKSPELAQATQFSNTAFRIATNIMAVPVGYLDMAVAVTGLFGGGGGADPEAARQAQLMSYLDAQFKQINETLHQIIDNQQKLMDGIIKLSRQLETVREQMHARFDVLQFDLQTIKELTKKMYLAPADECTTVQINYENHIYKLTDEKGAKRFKRFDLTNFSQLEAVSAINQDDTVGGCVQFLEKVFLLAARPPSSFSKDPLAARYAMVAPDATFPIQQDVAQVNGYDSDDNVRLFVYNYYKPTWRWFHARQKIKGDANSTAYGLAMLAAPSPDLSAFKRKKAFLTGEKHVCIKNSRLSEPLFALLCSRGLVDNTPDGAPDLPVTADENWASQRALQITETPLMQEPLVELANFALVFSSIYDTLKPSGARYSSRAALLSGVVTAKGPQILRPAVKTLTMAIAQTNLLHGDVTSWELFEALWNPVEKRFLTEAEVNADGVNKDALKTAKDMVAKNPFLAKNTLMIALGELKGDKASGGGEGLAYGQAIGSMKNSSFLADTALRSFFGSNMVFISKHEPIDGTKTPDCTPLNDQEKEKQCYRIPSVSIAGILVPLPNEDEFQHRAFVYPPIVYSLIDARDKLAIRLTHYTVLDFAAKKLKASPEDVAFGLLKAAQ